MPAAGSDAATGGADAKAALRHRRGIRRALLAFGVALLLFAGGFLWFVDRLAVAETPARNADGIVALTGSAFRINDALDLLASGHGRRLLITGVNRTTRPVEISRLVPEHRRLFDCCVDLDYSAANTVGNAIETQRWVKGRGFKSLIVVTSNFHMPRAMAELEHRLPGVALLPFPVVSDKVRVESWWSNPSTARLLFSEYVKYIVAVARMRLDFAFA